MEDSLRKKKILVVDDDLDLKEIIQAGLTLKGYEVISAADGSEAIVKVRAEHPDLIVADLMMPNLNGWKLSQKIKEDPRYKSIPIILLSGLINEEGMGDDVQSGDFYMTKPFDFEKLLTKIQELI